MKLRSLYTTVFALAAPALLAACELLLPTTADDGTQHTDPGGGGSLQDAPTYDDALVTLNDSATITHPDAEADVAPIDAGKDTHPPPIDSSIDRGGSGDTGAVDVMPPPPDAPPPITQALGMWFYGWPDETPPGDAIAYPSSNNPTIHDTAGGIGTYDDPITFGTDAREIPIGTRIYVADLKKYLVMEDACTWCTSDWTQFRSWEIVVWMNSNASSDNQSFYSCENYWSMNTTVEIDPPPGRPVSTAPLFDPATNSCRPTP